MLFCTFIVGLRCFSDFDRGLQPSKVKGQSYVPVASLKLGAFNGNHSHSSIHAIQILKEHRFYRKHDSETFNLRRRRPSQSEDFHRVKCLPLFATSIYRWEMALRSYVLAVASELRSYSALDFEFAVLRRYNILSTYIYTREEIN